MHRIDTPTAQVDKFGAGKNGFTRGNPQTGVPATALDDDYFDAVQEELAGIVEAAGIVLDKTNRAQLLAAIQHLITLGIPDLEDASLTQKGIVQLSNATNSNSQILAATPKSVSDLGALLLKISNNLSEIKDAGPTAVAQTLLNLGLGDVAHLPQLTGIVGTSRNAKMSIPVTLATATFTADELIVQTELGGLQYKLSSFSKTINLATTGAGGMDTGTVPATGYVALYAIYNPTTQVSALLAVNTTSVLAPEICSGVMPAGYTASALVSVWRIVASKFIPGEQVNRSISIQSTTAFTITVSTPATTIASISSIVPVNTKRISGIVNILIATAGGGNYTEFNLFSSASSVGRQSARYGAPSIGDMNCNYSINVNGQNVYYSALSASGSLTASAYISKYEF